MPKRGAMGKLVTFGNEKIYLLFDSNGGIRETMRARAGGENRIEIIN